MVGPPTAELERGWPCLKYKQKEYQRKYDAKRQATPHRKAWKKEYDAKRRQKRTMTSKYAWGQANNQRMLEEADAYLGVFWLPHGQPAGGPQWTPVGRS